MMSRLPELRFETTSDPTLQGPMTRSARAQPPRKLGTELQNPAPPARAVSKHEAPRRT